MIPRTLIRFIALVLFVMFMPSPVSADLVLPGGRGGRGSGRNIDWDKYERQRERAERRDQPPIVEEAPAAPVVEETPDTSDDSVGRTSSAMLLVLVLGAMLATSWQSMRRYALPALVMITLSGCPAPVPIRGNRCATDDNIRANCGLCSSARVCAWCASSDPAVRGCFDRSQATPPCPGGTVVLTLEACELVPPDEAGL